MIGLDISLRPTFENVEKAASKANFANISHAARSINKDAKASIKSSEEPSAPGSPPNTRGRIWLRRAIRYAVDKENNVAVIGPLESMVGESAVAHELGGMYRGEDFDKRPFMGPALERATPRLAETWRGTIG